MGVHNSTLSPRGSSIKQRWLRLGIDDQTARRYDSSLGGEGVTEMARLSQEVNASSINPSSPVQWREFSHSLPGLPHVKEGSNVKRICVPERPG